MRKPPKNLAASILARLRNVSRQKSLDHTQTLTQYAIERFLYRLSISEYKQRFLLKGAMLLVVWEASPYRATRDLDLLGFGDLSPEELSKVFAEIAAISVSDDGIEYDAASIKTAPIQALREYVGVRVNMRARIGTVRISMQVDVGAGDSVVPPPREVVFPALIDFPAPRLMAYPAETVVAEKLQAIAKLGMLNTRMKDYCDLIYLIRHFDFEGLVLSEAVAATFSRRHEHLDSPELLGLSAAFADDPVKRTQWSAFLHKSRISFPEMDLAGVVVQIRQFAEPILQAIVRGTPFNKHWTHPGPWKQT